MAYWFKVFCPNANVILNDSECIIHKLDAEVISTYLKDITIEHKPIEEYFNTNADSILILNPREFNVNVLKFMTNSKNNGNMVLIGSTKNTNTDYVSIYNTVISPLDNFEPIPASSLIYVTEFEYVLPMLNNTMQDSV